MTLSLDAVLQTACPCVMVPRYEPLALLREDSHRFLAAGDGLYVEVRRPWVHAILRVVASPIPLPYGLPPPLFNIGVSQADLRCLLHRFIEDARRACPQEVAAWVTFDPVGKRFGYEVPEVLSSGNEHIQYRRIDAGPNCLPMIDCHSHGVLPAFFSKTDNVDDLNDDAKLAVVVGNLDRQTPSVAMRFSGFGLTVDLSDWVTPLLYTDGVGEFCSASEGGNLC